MNNIQNHRWMYAEVYAIKPKDLGPFRKEFGVAAQQYLFSTLYFLKYFLAYQHNGVLYNNLIQG